MQRKRFRLLLFIFLVFGLLQAQYPFEPSESKPLSVIMYADKISRAYEVRLTSTLSSYCEKETYEVDVAVNLKSRQATGVGGMMQTSQTSSGDLGVGGLVMPGTEGRFVNEFVDDLEGLGGFSMPNQSTVTQTVVPAASGNVSDYEIDNVVVNVMLDASAYTTEDVSFIDELVKMKAGIDLYRGDIINVSLVKFTNQKQKMIEEAKKAEEEAAKLKAEEEEKRLQEELEAEEQAKANAAQQPKEEDSDFFTYLIVGLIGLLLLIGFLVAFFFMSKKNSAMADANMVQPKVNFPRYDEQFDSLMQEMRELKKVNRVSEPEKMEIAEYKKLRSFAINKFLAEAKNVGIVLQGWVDSGGDEGIDKASKLIKAIDENLLDLLEGKVSHDDFKLLSWNIRNMDDLDVKTKLEALQNFKNAWSSLTATDDDKDDTGMFGFLNSMSVEQIRQALKGESDGVQALVITQVSAEKASELLSSYPIEQRSAVMGNMGKLGKIPTSVYKEVSSRLAQEALKMRGMEYVSSDGAGKMLEILDTLNTAQQKEFIDEITKADVATAEKVLKFFIAFEDLDTLEEDILVRVIQKLDRELLSAALVGVDEVKLNSILSNVPERMREIIRSELLINTNKLKTEDIERARRKMMVVVRKEIKEAGGRTIGEPQEEGMAQDEEY